MQGCFLYSVYGSDGKFVIILSSDCRYQSLFFGKSWKTNVEFFFRYLSKWECKKYICGSFPFTAIEVYPTTYDATEKPRNVKKVRWEFCIRAKYYLTQILQGFGSWSRDATLTDRKMIGLSYTTDNRQWTFLPIKFRLIKKKRLDLFFVYQKSCVAWFLKWITSEMELF